MNLEEKNSEIDISVKEISVKDLFDKLIDTYFFLRSHWIKIFFTGLISGLLGVWYASKQPLNYIANLTFVVEEGKSSSNSFGGLASLAGQFGVDFGNSSSGGLFSGDNILLYFKSPALSREVLLSPFLNDKKMSIADKYSEVFKLKENWLKDSKIGDVKFQIQRENMSYTRVQDSLLQFMISSILKGQFTVNRTDKKASFIEVTTKMIDENLAKLYCERVVEIAIKRYVNLKTLRQKSTVDKLQLRADSLAKLLNQKTTVSATLQTTNSTMDINPIFKTKALYETESTMRDKTMLATIYGSVIQNLEIAKFTLSQETPVIQIIDNPQYPLKSEKLSKRKTALLFSTICSSILILLLLVIKFVRKNLK